MWNASVVQNNTSIIPDQRRRIHRIDQSRGSSVRCPNKSVSVLSPQSQIVPTVQKWETGWAVLGLAACHTNWKMEQVRRADQALYSIQSCSFAGRGPWLYATSPCWNQKAEKEATVEVLLLLRSSTHTHPAAAGSFLEDHKRWLSWCPMWVGEAGSAGSDWNVGGWGDC